MTWFGNGQYDCYDTALKHGCGGCSIKLEISASSHDRYSLWKWWEEMLVFIATSKRSKCVGAKKLFLVPETPTYLMHWFKSWRRGEDQHKSSAINNGCWRRWCWKCAKVPKSKRESFWLFSDTKVTVFRTHSRGGSPSAADRRVWASRLGCSP